MLIDLFAIFCTEFEVSSSMDLVPVGEAGLFSVISVLVVSSSLFVVLLVAFNV